MLHPRVSMVTMVPLVPTIQLKRNTCQVPALPVDRSVDAAAAAAVAMPGAPVAESAWSAAAGCDNCSCSATSSDADAGVLLFRGVGPSGVETLSGR